jgi:hypothetical protein
MTEMKIETRVCNRKTYEKEADRKSIKIGRPSVYGNPYVMGKHGSREAVIAAHKKALWNDPVLLQKTRTELPGHDLICFCAPLACHGLNYLEIINMSEEQFQQVLHAASQKLQ